MTKQRTFCTVCKVYFRIKAVIRLYVNVALLSPTNKITIDMLEIGKRAYYREWYLVPTYSLKLNFVCEVFASTLLVCVLCLG